MRIETIRIHNFKAFREAEMTDIPPFCVVVGANGSGKSTLFDIRLLSKPGKSDNYS